MSFLRERERERETERETDRDRERETERETEGIYTYIERETEICIYIYKTSFIDCYEHQKITYFFIQIYFGTVFHHQCMCVCERYMLKI